MGEPARFSSNSTPRVFLSNGTGAQRRPNFTEIECSMLIMEIKKFQDILDGRFSKMYSRDIKDRLWTEVTKRVNSIGTVQRTTDEIKIKWKNIRSAARAKCSQLRLQQDFKKTNSSLQDALPVPGSSNADIQLTAQDQMVLSIIEAYKTSEELGPSEMLIKPPPLPQEIISIASMEGNTPAQTLIDLKQSPRVELEELEGVASPAAASSGCNNRCPHCCASGSTSDLDLDQQRLLLKRRKVDLLERLVVVKERKLELLNKTAASNVVKVKEEILVASNEELTNE